MIAFTEEKKKQIWEEVREELPDDEMMQQIHYVRLLHYYQTKDMTSQERVRFFNKVLKESEKVSTSI